jgi:hypothetical protein
MTTEAEAYFCPECGSPSIDRSVLSGGSATCRACGWAGSADKLAVLPFAHALGDDNQILIALVGDLRLMLAKDVGNHFAKFLTKWGFIDVTGANKALAGRRMGRYLSAIARSIVTALLQERDKMEAERARGS